jgi:uncharacterized protein (DUF362 family)
MYRKSDDPIHFYPCGTKRDVSRRDFLRLAGLTAAGLAAAACSPKTSSPEESSGAPSASGGPALTGTARPVVAVAEATDYDPATLERKLAEMIDQLGGLGDVVKSGDRVGIKINMTGGVNSGTLPGVAAIDSFITHPMVVQALIKRVQAAGAKEIFIVEAAYEWASFTDWGYEEVAANTGAKLIDLTDSKPYDDFVEVPVGENSFIYPKFTMNKLLTELDVFMSVSKMKNHYEAGVTHTMKNLYGLVPFRFYRLNAGDSYRSEFHGESKVTRNRLPRVIVDLNRARPIHFGLVDGIWTTEGGEGPWIASMTPLKANLLVAGKNPVATDAVATACMGHNPEDDYGTPPYYRTDNHLKIAAEMGLGTNRLADIDVVGAKIDKVKKQFHGAA